MICSEEFQKAVQIAKETAKKEKHKTVDTVHLLSAVLSSNCGKQMAEKCCKDFDLLIKNVSLNLAKFPNDAKEGSIPKCSKAFDKILDRTLSIAEKNRRESIDIPELFLALYEPENEACGKILRENGIMREVMVASVLNCETAENKSKYIMGDFLETIIHGIDAIAEPENGKKLCAGLKDDEIELKKNN